MSENAADAAGTTGMPIVDFHTHFVGPSFHLTTLAHAPPPVRGYWLETNRRLADPAALIASIDEAGLAARVINTPTAFLADADGNVAGGTCQRINDGLAAFAAKHHGRIYALATIDAFSGDAGARELTRAIRDLGLRGVFLESSKGGRLLDAPEARPTLQAAAALGVPVFIHPVTDPELYRRIGGSGRAGLLFARGTLNAASLIAMLENGVFDELPGLRVVVTALAIGGVMVAGSFGGGHGIRSDAPALARRHVYIDIMGLDPAMIRGAVHMLGADHVVMGTDWPVFVEPDVPQRLRAALDACGLSPQEQAMIAGGNALRLLGVA